MGVGEGLGLRWAVETSNEFKLLCSPTPARVTCLNCNLCSFVATLLALGAVKCREVPICCSSTMQLLRIFAAKYQGTQHVEEINTCCRLYMEDITVYCVPSKREEYFLASWGDCRKQESASLQGWLGAGQIGIVISNFISGEILDLGSNDLCWSCAESDFARF